MFIAYILFSVPLFNGRFYAVLSGAFTLNDAFDKAAASTYRGMTGFLAPINGIEDYAFLRWSMKVSDAWLGISDFAVENTWRTLAGPTAGALAPYVPFSLGEGRDGTVTNCIVMTSTGLADTSCTSSGQNFVVAYECRSPMILFDNACICKTAGPSLLVLSFSI